MARPVPTPRSLDGWSLDLALELDDLDPGFLVSLHRASALQAQATYAALAEIAAGRATPMLARLAERGLTEAERRGGDLAMLARFLRCADPRTIIEVVHGEVPDGMLGALRRVGGAAMEPDAYPRLHRLLTDPAQRRRGTLLRHIGEVTGTSLAVLDTLDPALLRPEIIKRVYTTKGAADLNRAINLLRTRCSTATDAALRESLSRLAEGASLSSWLAKWARKADRLPSPIPEDDDLWPLRTAALLLQHGRAYRNCLAQKVGEALLGYRSYVAGKRAPAIAELQNLGHGRWLLDGLYGPGNEPPAADVADAIRAKLDGLGIIVPATPVIDHDLQPVAHLFGVYGREPLGGFVEDDAAQAGDI
jgi:hypothetical protein